MINYEIAIAALRIRAARRTSQLEQLREIMDEGANDLLTREFVAMRHREIRAEIFEDKVSTAALKNLSRY